ncbi:C1 family peptidase [Daejeonella oryzae]|uniref:C1 family peptidase n=1 Tax=Daejeonella oryzae TaxID=1122943 RepID=UPI0003F6DAE5|nr:C1 family peptidase [Daejeonella oryzae]
MEYSMGWMKDYPDFRDYAISTDQVSEKLKVKGQKDSIKDMLNSVGIKSSRKKETTPSKIDLRQWCSPIENQGPLGSCTAHAGIGVVEYYENRAFGKHLDGSHLFLYKTTRNLLNWKGDTGAYLRSTMAAMAMFGIALEKYWPYDIKRFEEEPGAFLYAIAQNYQALSYYRLDPIGTDPQTILNSVKIHLQAGLPSMFGFTCYSSLYTGQNGQIPFPAKTEKVVGGHAIVAIGYDDSIVIKNGDVKTTGALMIRNSWGEQWGMEGYGYLPYEYILKGLAVDFWVLLKCEWVDSGKFGL